MPGNKLYFSTPVVVGEARRRAHYEEAAPEFPRPESIYTPRRFNDPVHVRRFSFSRTVPRDEVPVLYHTTSIDIDASQNEARASVENARDNLAEEFSKTTWHKSSINDIESDFHTSSGMGLCSEQVEANQTEYGVNSLSPPSKHWTRKLCYYLLAAGFGPVLLLAAILALVAWMMGGGCRYSDIVLSGVLFGVFFIQVGLSAWQDHSTSSIMASITSMLPEDCSVIRNGSLMTVSVAEVVPGDVVQIEAGNKLPADLRFTLVSPDAKFDRSILTGESRPLAGTINFTDENYLQTANIGLQGCSMTRGSCTGIVVATGNNTVFGRLVEQTNRRKSGNYTLLKEIYRFLLVVSVFTIVAIAVVVSLWGGVIRKNHPGFIDGPAIIVTCASLLVAFIPEGLPVALAISLVITSKRMKKHQIICKSLQIVETLGCVSVICSDKTGTLTKNEMTVSDCTVAGLKMSAEEAKVVTRIDNHPIRHPIRQLLAMAVLCNASEPNQTTCGDPTDQAILRFPETISEGIVADLRACWQQIFELPFNSKNKFMIRCFENGTAEGLSMTLQPHQTDFLGDEDILLTIKGAPDILLSRCGYYVSRTGRTVPLDQASRGNIEHIKNEYSSQGKRCLLLARKIVHRNNLPDDKDGVLFENAVLESSKTDLVFVGLVALVDPLRDSIPNCVATLRNAGIRIAMVTGDFALTALAIARKAGIVTATTVDDVSALYLNGPGVSDTSGNEEKPTRAIILSGSDLMTLNDNNWKVLTAYEEIVFARTTPQQKLRIVREFKRNDIVAMTGDGVNDAPALNEAHVGICVGSGSTVAKEASDVILEGKFCALVQAVKHGRVIFENLKKVISYLLPAGSFSEFWPIIAHVLMGLPEVLSSFLMIIICCVTDSAAAIALSFEQPESEVLCRPPRNTKKDHLVDWKLLLQAFGVNGVLQTTAAFTMSFWYLSQQGMPFTQFIGSYGKIPDRIDQEYYTAKVNVASCVYFVTLVVMQWFNLMAIRTRVTSIFRHPPWSRETQNWFLFLAISISCAVVIAVLYAPGSKICTAPIPLEHWLLPISFGILLLCLDEMRKWAVRKNRNGIWAKLAW